MKNIYDIVGKYVLVRSYNEGINAGTVVMAGKDGIVLSGARRLHSHKPADNLQAWYEGVANSGLSNDSDSEISSPVAIKGIIEDYSYTICTDDAKLSIVGYPSATSR